MAGISSFLFGSPQKTQQLPLFSPEQQQALSTLRQSGVQQLQQNPLSFEPIEKRVTKQFEEQTIPTLAERFTAMGGGQRSSAFKGALGNVGQDLAERLAALRSQYNLQANQQGLQQLQTGLMPEFQNLLQPRQQGLFENLLSTIAGGAGLAGTSYLGGGGSSQLLSLLQQLFGGNQPIEAQPVSFQSQMQQGLQPSQGNAVGSQQLMNLLLQTLGGR